MNYIEKPNNKVYILGEVLSKASFSHEVYGEGFYEMNVSVKRKVKKLLERLQQSV